MHTKHAIVMILTSISIGACSVWPPQRSLDKSGIANSKTGASIGLERQTIQLPLIVRYNKTSNLGVASTLSYTKEIWYSDMDTAYIADIVPSEDPSVPYWVEHEEWRKYDSSFKFAYYDYLDGLIQSQQIYDFSAQIPKLFAFFDRDGQRYSQKFNINDVLTRESFPVVNTTEVSNAVSAGWITSLPSDVVLGYPTIVVERTASNNLSPIKLFSSFLRYRVWIEPVSGLKLRYQYEDVSHSVGDFTAVEIVPNASVDEHLSNGYTIHADAATDVVLAEYLPTTLTNGADYPGLSQVKVVRDSSLDTGYSVAPAIILTSTLQTLHVRTDFEPVRVGWFVVQQIMGTNGADIVVIHAPSDKSLPIEQDYYWPDTWGEFANQLGPDESIERSQDVTLSDGLTTTLYVTNPPDQVRYNREPLAYKYILPIKNGNGISSVFLVNGLSQIDALAMIELYRNHSRQVEQ